MRETNVDTTPDTRFSIWESIEAAMASALAVQPTKQFLRQGEQSLTYEEADRQSAALAFGLAELGVARGDRVAVMMPNSLEHVLTLLACARARIKSGRERDAEGVAARQRLSQFIASPVETKAALDERVDTRREEA